MLYVPTALSTTIQHAISTHTTPTPTPTPTHHTHTHTLTLPYSNPDHPVSQLTLHYPTSPLVTLSHSTIPLPTTIHLSTYYHQPIVHHNRYPPITHIQLHHHLPCHYPTIHHLLLTILLFYPPR
ncbi:putative golgin subfamily A member 6-like protein 6 [Saccharomyces cerevisiae]|nr:putative golgin subfamily A member 6-like protein 6 [Saccharomyces cerevisiae]